MLGGAGLGIWFTGKPRHAWHGAWHRCMGLVHGVVHGMVPGVGAWIGFVGLGGVGLEHWGLILDRVWRRHSWVAAT